MLFDLPGTVGNEGVLSTIVELDYLFIPMKADRIVLESTLNFASVLNDRLINKDIQEAGGPVYRCTLLPPDRAFVAECGFDRLMTEICAVLKLPCHE